MEEAKIVATFTSTTILFMLMINIILLNVAVGLPDEKIVVITNNHTNYLSIRCFSFVEDGNVKHLSTKGSFNITVKIKISSPLQQCTIAPQTWVHLLHLNTIMGVLAVQRLVNGDLMRTIPIDIVPRSESGLLMNTIRIMSLLLEEVSSKGIMLTNKDM
uniref:Putative ovule protein n=1 Tax=Solanum chacoense TaxID=4108 RepID=A0A0V0HF51_SOLCH